MQICLLLKLYLHMTFYCVFNGSVPCLSCSTFELSKGFVNICKLVWYWNFMMFERYNVIFKKTHHQPLEQRGECHCIVIVWWQFDDRSYIGVMEHLHFVILQVVISQWHCLLLLIMVVEFLELTNVVLFVPRSKVRDPQQCFPLK